jgi:hypothetical protein
MSKRNFEQENYQEALSRPEKRRRVDCDDVSAIETPKRKLTHDDYTVGWICPLEVEQST